VIGANNKKRCAARKDAVGKKLVARGLTSLGRLKLPQTGIIRRKTTSASAQ